MPSMTQISYGPCDSPAVLILNPLNRTPLHAGEGYPLRVPATLLRSWFLSPELPADPVIAECDEIQIS